MRTALAAGLIGGAVLLAAGRAGANTITQTFTFPSLYDYGTEDATSPIDLFNPTLGTLDSVTVNATVTATFSDGSSTFDNVAEYRITVVDSDFIIHASRTGNGTAIGSLINDTVDADFASFTGKGTTLLTLLVLDYGETSANVRSVFGTESITYNFTPSKGVPLPEPGSLVLLGTALLGLGVVGWARRHRAG